MSRSYYWNERRVDNSDFLTVTQEKMMATQPDMILQYAKMIKKKSKVGV